MKAFLLAAGYGTRLRPITNEIPKCLVPIHGQPILGWWFFLLQKHGVTEVLVNTHYLSNQVREYIQQYNLQKTGLTVFEAYEPALLGSGGTVRKNKAFVQGEKSFLICYADNLTDANLTALQQFHEGHADVLSMALFHASHPEQFGIVELDQENTVQSFIEKPSNPKSDLANAGIYAVNQEIFDYLNTDQPVLDFGKDVLPKFVGKMKGWYIDGYWMDIGTLENYKRANMEWPINDIENA